MSRAIAPLLIVLGVLQVAACGGDDTVNPSNPEAGAPAPKDASSGDARDAAKPSESDPGHEAGPDAPAE
jgi:hypothetical protein